MYGITETTVHVTYRPLEEADTEKRGGSPIGCQIPDLRVYILDSNQEPAPVGMAGELYVGGAGVARGYLNRAELTSERFLRDPFVEQAGARMYRTGDLARWLEDGTIEFLGRNDFQVKIRGFRIELGEIEARLAEHVGVQDAVVLAREDTPGHKRLVAYYTSAAKTDARPVDVEQLRAHLTERLPEYMVPAAYVWLESLPLTPNGKLDRRGLPAPEGDVYAVRGYEAPIGEIETGLAEIWAELLKVERVGRQDNFFALGGDSIRVIGILSRIREQGWGCTAQDIFKHQTITSLASAISRGFGSEPIPVQELSEPLISDADALLVPEDIADAYSLSSLQLGMIYQSQLTPQLGVYHDVFSSYLRIQDWDIRTFQAVLDALVQKHPILRTSIALHRFSEPLQLGHWQAAVPLAVSDLRGMDASIQEKTILT